MIKLREYKKSDADRLVQLANNMSVSRYLVYTFPYPYTRKDADWWIAIGAKENGAEIKVIEYHGEFIGSVGINREPGWKSHIAEVGYWLGEEYWGRHIATDALKLMCDLVFSENRYRKLFAPVLAPNKASMKVLEKNGFELEGVLKQEVFKDEEYFDVHHYAKYCL